MSIDHLCTSLTVLFLGDFNYHANAVANVYTKELFGLFECFGLKNDVEIEFSKAIHLISSWPEKLNFCLWILLPIAV